MFGTNRRRVLTAVLLVSGFLLLPVRPAAAAPRGGGERESTRSIGRIAAQWEHAAVSLLVSLLEKSGVQINPDGIW